MKKIFKTSFILLSLLSVMFVSCRKEYEIPPIQVLPEGRMYSIADLLALPATTTFDTASVCGFVTADEQSGNLYKAIFIQDPETGKAIQLMLNTSSAARVGDSVRVFLDKHIMVNNYHNLPQLTGTDGKGFSPDGHLIIYPKNKPIAPDTVTIAQIKSGLYTAGLVYLKDVEFVEQGSAFCNVGETTNRTLKDETGEMLVRTSNYANFAYDPLPTGKGALVGIASVYNNDWQLLIRSKRELSFEGGEPTPPAVPGEVQKLPYTQKFTADFGTYTTYNVFGNHVWSIDYSTAKITGHEGGNPGTDYANEDWLISSPVDLTTVENATVSMTYIGRYFTRISDEVTLWASTDYTFGGNPTTATWVQLPATLTEGSNWNDFLTVEVAVDPSLVGNNVTFAVKYTSTDQKAGTMEVQSITIKEGEPGGGGITPPEGVTGDGSRENPFTAYDVLLMNTLTSDGNKYWVKDYIVGVVNYNNNSSFEFTSSTTVSICIAISSNVDTEDPASCAPVQLPSGVVQSGVNLVDHPEHYKQEVLLYGTLEKYFGQAGVKNVTYAEVNGGCYGVDPGYVPPTPTGELHDLPYDQSFATEFGTYITYNVTGDQVWEIAYSSAKMTGYVSGSKYDNEDWLISEPFNMPVSAAPVVKLEYVGCYFESDENISEDVTIWVSDRYHFGDQPNPEDWVQVPCALQNSTSWDFQTVEVELSVPGLILGETANIAVKYVSSPDRAGTIEISNITIEEGSGVTPDPTPPTPDEPVETVDVATVMRLQEVDTTVWVQGYIVGAVKKNKMATNNDNIDWMAPFSGDRAVLLADTIGEYDITNCIVVELPANTELRTQVNLKDNEGNLNRVLRVKGNPGAYLSHEGLKGCPGTANDFALDPQDKR